MFRYSGILSGLKGNACENFRRNGTLNLQFLTQKMKRNKFVPFERKSTAVFSITNRYHIPSTEHSSRSIINQLEHCLFGISDLAKERGKENENRNTSEIVLLFSKKKKLTTHTSVVRLFIQNESARVTCHRRTFFSHLTEKRTCDCYATSQYRVLWISS